MNEICPKYCLNSTYKSRLERKKTTQIYEGQYTILQNPLSWIAAEDSQGFTYSTKSPLEIKPGTQLLNLKLHRKEMFHFNMAAILTTNLCISRL